MTEDLEYRMREFQLESINPAQDEVEKIKRQQEKLKEALDQQINQQDKAQTTMTPLMQSAMDQRIKSV